MRYRPPDGRFAGAGIGGGSVLYRLCWGTTGINGTQNYEAKMDEKCPWAFFMGRTLPMNPLCPPGCRHEQTVENCGTQNLGD